MVVSTKHFLFVAILYLASTCHSADTTISDGANESLPLEVLALAKVYPSQIVNSAGEFIYLANGDSVAINLNQELSHEDKLAAPDISSMFCDLYPLGPLVVPDYQFDPGRYRNEQLFMSMYGHTSNEVRKNLVYVDCFGSSVPFSRINGAADSLRSVIREVAQSAPHLIIFFEDPSSFYWREVRGADRLSAHSFGIAIDIGVKYSNYWRWSNPGKDENDVIRYENKFPEELIMIFEKHGFISGARWYHYDTMHFEFRPEIIIYSLMHLPDNSIY